MQRIGFVIQVQSDKLDEYKRLHDPIWPEMQAEIRAAGIRNYSLWLREDGTEFGYLECEDWDAACAYLANSEVNQRWQTLMQGFLLTSLDEGKGGQPIQMLERSFLLE